jgi:hypothetical protein
MEFLLNLPRMPALGEADLQVATVGTWYKVSDIKLHRQVEVKESRATTNLRQF